MSRTPRIPRSGLIERERDEATGPAPHELLRLLPAVGDVLLVERVERAVVADVAGGQQQRVDAELVHALDHHLGLTEAVFGIAPDLHRDIRRHRARRPTPPGDRA